MLTKDTSGNNAIIVQLKNVRDHPNADRLKLATVLGATVIVGLEAKEGGVVIYFDSNLRLSHDYLRYNNLYSSAELNVDSTQKGYFGKNGRVRAQKFRGEISNGYVAEINSLHKCVLSKNSFYVRLNEGDEFTHLDGIKICEKYLLPVKNKQGTSRQPISRMFHRHWDTKQLMRELNSIPAGATCYLEEKIHGTSGRTGRVLVDVKKPWWKFWQDKREAWKVVSGTRRVDDINFHLPEIRAEVERRVAPHLHKGEEIYYEIYGYDKGKHIQVGFPYDCRGGEWKAMLYRVTLTTPDGFCIDMDREYVYNRATELGLEQPYLFETCYGNEVQDEANSYAGGVSALDAGTLREGVVVWFRGNDYKWTALKLKSQEFSLSQDKLMEKDVGDVEDVL